MLQWKRLHRDDKLGTAPEQALKLLPVSVTEELVPEVSEVLKVVPTRFWTAPGRHNAD